MTSRRFKNFPTTVGGLMDEAASKLRYVTPREMERRVGIYYCQPIRVLGGCTNCATCAEKLTQAFEKMVEPGVRQPLGRLVTQLRLAVALEKEALFKREIVVPVDEFGRPVDRNPFEELL